MRINIICNDEYFTLEKFQSIFENYTVESTMDSFENYDLIIINISQLDDIHKFFDDIKTYGHKTMFVSTSNKYNIKYAFDILNKNKPPSHIVGLNDDVDLMKVKEIANCILTNSVFRLDEVLKNAIDVVEIKIDDSSNISQTIKDVLKQFDFKGCFSAIKDSLSQLINELLYNALYNAPTDEDGKQIFKNQDRKLNIKLDVKKSASLKIVNGQDNVSVSVIDKYGSITKEVIDAHISRNSVSDKAGGAGIGLSLIYNNSHELIFVVEPGVKTEVISVVNKYKRYKTNMEHVRSFHFFVKGKS